MNKIKFLIIIFLSLPVGKISANGEEFLIDTSIVYVPTLDDQTFPSIAYDGTNYLVVWQDRRSGLNKIYGTRVSKFGTVLDPAGIPISTAANWQEHPSVAFDGTNYFVVWQDHRSGSLDIYGTRVSQSGAVLDTAGIPISTTANNQWSPSIAYDGTNYLVVWEDYRSASSYDIYGARVSKSGTVLDTSGIPISTGTNYKRYPSIAYDGTNYLVVWTDYRSGSDNDIYGTRVSQDGIVLDTSGIPISTVADEQGYSSVAYDGMNYLVVWQDGRSGSYSDIYGTRVSQDGIVLDTSGIPISTAVYSQCYPSIAYDGTNYLVVWTDSRSGWSNSDIYGVRVSKAGAVFDSFPVSTQSKNQSYPALVSGQDTFLITWHSWTDYINGHHANTIRIWGKFYPFIGTEELPDKTQSAKLEIFPTPFTHSAILNYYIPIKSYISLKIYDISGREIKTLVNGEKEAGSYDVNLDAKELPSGIYFVKFQTSNYQETKKLILVR